MAESGVIREFLVSLGFKIDKTGQEGFVQAIEGVTSKVLRLATAVEGTAVGVALGVARFATNLEKLYFVGQRTGSSVTSLRAFQQAAEDFGASGSEAVGSVEGLSQSLRMNPGNAALLESLGVHLKRTKDGTYDATDALIQFGNVMRERGYFKPGHFYMAEQYARMFGINERTLLAMRNGSFDKTYSKIHGEIQGQGFKKAAADAHRFMNSLRNLQTQLEVFGAQVEDAIQKKLGVNLKHLNRWLQAHGPEMASHLVQAAEILFQGAEWIGRAFEWLIPKLQWFNRHLDGWPAKIAALLLVMRAIGGFEVIGAVARLASAFVGLGSGIGAAISAGGAFGAILSTLAVLLAGLAAYELGKHIVAPAIDHGVSDLTGHKDDTLGGWLYGRSHRVQRAMTYFESQGWTPWQAAGLVANLRAESGLMTGKVGDKGAALGIAQWHKARQEEFQRVMGRPLKGSSFDQQLAFVNYEARNDPEYGGARLAQAKTASAAGRIVSEYFERPADRDVQAADRAALAHRMMESIRQKEPFLTQLQAHWHLHGLAAHTSGAGATINQHTEISVHGSGTDPSQTVHDVAGQQRRVNADMIRHFVTGPR